MEKDINKLFKELIESISEFTENLEKASKDATGKSLDEIMKMPTETKEERMAFVEELLKIKNKLDGSKPYDFEGQYVKITGGKTCTQFEARGCTKDLIHLLAQGVSAVIKNSGLKEEKVDDFLDMFKAEVKEMQDNGIVL